MTDQEQPTPKTFGSSDYVKRLLYTATFVYSGICMYETYQTLGKLTKLLEQETKKCGTETKKAADLKKKVMALGFLFILLSALLCLSVILMLGCKRTLDLFKTGKKLDSVMHILLIVLLLFVQTTSFVDDKLRVTKLGSGIAAILFLLITLNDNKKPLVDAYRYVVPKKTPEEKAQAKAAKAEKRASSPKPGLFGRFSKKPSSREIWDEKVKKEKLERELWGGRVPLVSAD